MSVVAQEKGGQHRDADADGARGGGASFEIADRNGGNASEQRRRAKRQLAVRGAITE